MIRISEATFDPGGELTAFEKRAHGAGAIVCFTGKVRGESDGGVVTSLHLEHFPGVTEKSVHAIEIEARSRWSLIDVLIIHRVGELQPGEPIVMACAAAAHRREAFEAADFMMDRLKTVAMFWKKERRSTGDKWIEPSDCDYTDAARWRVDR